MESDHIAKRAYQFNVCLLYTSHGARALILDPKSERGKWKEMLPELSDEINIINLTSDEVNKGMLDPYVIMQNKKDAESLAMDILTFLTGDSINNGKRSPLLRDAVKAVTDVYKRQAQRKLRAGRGRKCDR